MSRVGVPTASGEAAISSPLNSRSLYAKVTWRLMPLLMIIYIVAFIDRSNVGLAKLGFVRDLRFNEAIYGFGAGIFYLGYVLLEIPSNIYIEKVGVRRTLLRIMLAWGLCSMLMALMTVPWHYYTLRLLLGAAEAGLFPGILLYLTYWIPPRRRAGVTALFMAAIPIAGMLGGPLGGWIMHTLAGAGGLRGWQWLFVLEGAPAIGLGVVAYLFLSDGPAQCDWLSPAEKAQLAAELTPSAAFSVSPAGRSTYRALAEPRLYCVAALGLAVMVSTAGLFLWLPTIIRTSGVRDIFTVGLLSGLPFVVGLVAQYLVARHSDQVMERRWHAVVPALFAAGGWALLPFAAHNTPVSLLLLTVAAAGTLGAMGPYWTLPTLVSSGGASAAGIALITTAAGCGNFISPIIVGWLATRTASLDAGLYYFAALLVLGSIVLVMGVKPNRTSTN